MNGNKIQIKQADTLLVSLEDAFKSLPKLPKGFTDFLVTVTPWLSLIFGVFLLVVVGLLGLVGLFASSVAVAVGVGPQYIVVLFISIALAMIQGLLMILAFKPTQKRELGGWRLLAYVELLSVVSAILAMNIVGILWGLFCTAIGFYLLFQIKHYYK